MSTLKGEKSKQKLFKAAEELFAKNGLKSTRVTDIVAKAGLTQAAFYLYYESKEDVFNQMLQEFDSQLLQLSDAGKHAGSLPPEDIYDYVKRTFKQIFSLLGKNPNLTRIALQQADDSDKTRLKIVEQIAGNMTHNQRMDIVSENTDPWLAAESIVAVTERLVHRYVLTGEKKVTLLAEQTAHLFLNGILKDTKEGE